MRPVIVPRRALAMLALLLSLACSEHSGDPAEEEPDRTISSIHPSTVAAMLEVPRITLNNPWSKATADYENARWCRNRACRDYRYLSYEGHPYITWKSDYEEKLAECRDFGDEESGGERICVPSNDTTLSCAVKNMLEYGYYCGAGRPAPGYWGKEPLDGVDYCCYLHDLRVWDDRQDLAHARAIESNLACGMVMCLYRETEFPAGAASAFPETQAARQCIHDWAASGCFGNQSNDSPGPTERLRATVVVD